MRLMTLVCIFQPLFFVIFTVPAYHDFI